MKDNSQWILEQFRQCGILFGWFMALNATCNNISAISWRSVLLVEETGGPGENLKFTNDSVMFFQTAMQ
jgi:hypothetical protein